MYSIPRLQRSLTVHDSTRILLEYDVGRDPRRLTRKLDVAATDSLSLSHGTNNLYIALLADTVLLYDTPRTLVCGNLHLESFGNFKGDSGLIYSDMSDFGEALTAPFTADLVRTLSGLQVASFGWKLTDEDAHNLCRHFLDTYAITLVEGKPRWVGRATATGIVRDLLRALRKHNRAAYLAQHTERVGNRISLHIDGRRILRASKDEARRAQHILEAYGQQGSSRRLVAVDVTRQIAGTGSLGLERYSMLTRPENDPATLRLIDIKLLILSVWVGVLDSAYNMAPWHNEAGCVVDIQCVPQAISPALLHGIAYSAKGGELRSYIVKSLQPTVDRVALNSGKNAVANLDDALQTMAHVAAWCHLCGYGRHRMDLVEKTQDYTAGMARRESALKLTVNGHKVSLK